MTTADIISENLDSTAPEPEQPPDQALAEVGDPAACAEDTAALVAREASLVELNASYVTLNAQAAAEEISVYKQEMARQAEAAAAASASAEDNPRPNTDNPATDDEPPAAAINGAANAETFPDAPDVNTKPPTGRRKAHPAPAIPPDYTLAPPPSKPNL